MKKRLVLTLMASALLVLAGCGGQTSSSKAADSSTTTSTPATSSAPTTSSTPSSSSSSETVYTAVTITNKTALQGSWHVGDSNLQIEISTTPEGNVTKLINEGKMTVTSSDSGIVSVIGVYLTAIAPGKATITVAMGTLSDTVDVTVLAADKDYMAVSLADGMKDGATNGAHTYISQVKVASFKTGSDGGTYGNFNVTDADGNNNTIVYGASASLSALAFNATTKVWKFTNPKDFMTNDATKAIAVGDMLDIVYIRCDYNGTKEISAVILGINGVALANRGTAAAPLTSDEVAALTDQQKLYTYYVSGKISAWTGTNTDGTDYGNFMLKSDGATGDAITVYGASATGTLAYNYTKNATVFTNPKDWKTNAATKDLQIGDAVTLQVIRSDYNTTKEVIGIVIPSAAKVDPVIGTKTIKDIAAYTASDSTVIRVSGIWAENHGTLKYGNGYLMDPATGDVVLVYGCSKTATGLTKTDSGLGYYTGVWANPQDFAADTLTLGSYVTIEGVVDYYSGTKTAELEGVITAEVKPTDAAYTYKYAASAATAENGTVALSKESELAFGEAVTITATPENGYAIGQITVDHGYAKEALTAVEGVYSFKANVKNVVTVTFTAVSQATYTSAAKFDFSAIPCAASTSPYGALDNDGVLALFTADTYKISGANPVTAVTVAKAYQANNTQGPKVLGLKLGAKSDPGSLALTLNVDVAKVVIHAYGWSTTNLATFTVGDAPTVALTNITGEDVSFVVTAGKSLTISTDKYCVITAIEFFTVAA